MCIENKGDLMFANIFSDNILMFGNILLSLQSNKYISECIWKKIRATYRAISGSYFAILGTSRQARKLDF